MGGRLTQVYVWGIALISVLTLAWVYLNPPVSMRTTRDGEPHLQARVINPETGEPISLDALKRHFTGD